ncbi:MAG: magnetosome biogenesis CDF transporter MamB [Alphaproteobacteria bacterium]
MTQPVCSQCRDEVVWWAVYVNLGMMVFKGLLGFMSGSHALIADAWHSGADVVASGVVLAAVKMSNRRPDERYPFGYGNVQFLSSAVVGLILLFGSLYLLYATTMRIVGGNLTAPSVVAALGAVVSVITNEMMFRYQSCVGRESNSPAIIANAWDNRSDALSSVGVLVGIGAAVAGYPIADSLAAIFVALLIAKIGIELNVDAIKGLIDSSVEMDVLRLVFQIAVDTPGVEGVHSLRGRYVGEEMHLEISVYVQGDLSMAEGDAIAASVRDQVMAELVHARDVRVAVTPAPAAPAGSRRSPGRGLAVVSPSA